MENEHVGNIVRYLGARAHMAAHHQATGTMDAGMDVVLPGGVLEARADSTSTSSSSSPSGTCGANACEKPVSESTFTLPIILGIAVPVIGAAILFIILQRRHTRKQREEDANDRHASMDFGLGDVPAGAKAKAMKRPTGDLDFSEKNRAGTGTGTGTGMSRRQVSMDMAVASPYLLPPELQESRESLHSLSRSGGPQENDPYAPVADYYPQSIHSKSKNGSSIYTASSMAQSKVYEAGATSGLVDNAAQMPRSPLFVPPPRQNSLPQSSSSASPVESIPPPYLAEPQQARFSDAKQGLPASPRPGQGRESLASSGSPRGPGNSRQSDGYLANIANARVPSPAPLATPSNGARKAPPPAINTLPTNPRPARMDSMPVVIVQGDEEYGDGFEVTPASPGRGNANNPQTKGQRYSMDVPPEQFAQAGLGAPGFDPKRLSMGFRPLPAEGEEHEDPELRANRIRSFYKEYFDDSKPAPQGQYYRNEQDNYLGEAAYFDPDSNAFVMPYAEPVTRRAMTPPPRGPPRFQGPAAAQNRGRQGSMGGMSAASNSMRGPASPGPRAFSSASGRMGSPGPKKKLPPPSPLMTVPTPSKLKDDSFMFMPEHEFAPPTSVRDRVAGRSESPFGERRAYSPAVPAFAPVVSTFEELAPMPSPHMLRNSKTFTSLDFAAPRKFRDPESMSDAGSIRSNKSGVSQMQSQAIRSGAYRVSRIQKDVVGTRDDLATSLKPQWGMRNE